MLKIKCALISVCDKAGIVDFALGLHNLGVEILSTGGTARALKEAKIPVIEVSDYTGFPEMLGGRVKTLHPKIHAGLLALRNNPEHLEALKKHDIKPIDMVVVNLYPFQETIQKPNVSMEEVIENIDIGGPAMLRSAAKNHLSVAVICNPSRYSEILEELNAQEARLSIKTLQELGVEVFRATSHYDNAIYSYLKERVVEGGGKTDGAFTQRLNLGFIKIQDLRYGENPHQKAAFYRDEKEARGLAGTKQLWGKELSFNNILDLNSAVNLVKEFELPAVAFIKHNNPCGVAEDKDVTKAYRNAWACDKLSAFGGIVAVNREIDLSLAKLIARSGFLECIICPKFSLEALSILKDKKNVRLLELPHLMDKCKGLDFKKVSGGLLLQDEDGLTFDENNLKVVTRRKPSQKEMESLIFSWKVAKHVKSNAIVLAKGRKTVGIGAGQMSRVDSVYIATKKAGKLTAGAVLASDAFFPKIDAIQLAAEFQIQAVIQPGGSIADEQIIKMADKYDVAMVFTGVRHFKH